MAIAHDWLEPTETTTDTQEMKFVDRVLEGWGQWSRSTGIDQRPVSHGQMWRIQCIIEEATHVLQLLDDDFILVDQTVAQLPWRLKHIVFEEYVGRGSWEEKRRRTGFKKFEYRNQLLAAQWSFYSLIQQQIDRWKSVLA